MCFKYCYRELRKVFVWSPRRLEVTADFIRAVVTEQGLAWLKKHWGELCSSGNSQNVGVECDKKVPWSFQQSREM